MNAIIYAAGRATRLGAGYAHQPKVMTEVGGETLLERHVQRLAAVGVKRLTVVTGHCHEVVATALPGLSRVYGLELQERFNPDFGEGSVISMLCSFPDIEAARDGLLLMDGDVLYGPEMLPRLIGSRHPSALLVDFAYSTADDDPVLAPIRDGKPFELRKQWVGLAERVGESVGFFKLSAADVPLLMQETKMRASGKARLDSLDEVLRALVRAGRFGYEDITGMPWTEIDFPGDVKYAREDVLPRIAAEEAARVLPPTAG
ncbi:MAG: NTP transferase domain-containing protein [Verrucomicrobiales bacterium]|nr:NTP transferase domain-containing protein [Verrucomicrobiales bacterium]